MAPQEEIDPWYEEVKQKALAALLAALERKEDPDASEKKYTEEIKKLFQRYKTKMLAAVERSKATKPIQTGAKKQSLLTNLVSKITRK